MKIKKKFIRPILGQLLTYKDDKPFSGLLTENICLGTKRKIQKIRRELLSHHEVLEEEIKDIQGDPEVIDRELAILSEEEVILTSEPFELARLDDVTSATNYDFEMLEMISK